MINIKKFFKQALYVSPLDRFLINYDYKHPELSSSQKQETDKYMHVHNMRDQAETVEYAKNSFWDKF